MSAKIISIDSVRTEDQSMLASFWTKWRHLHTPEGRAEYLAGEQAFRDSIQSNIPAGLSFGLVPFCGHRLWCAIMSNGATATPHFLLDGAPAAAELTNEQAAYTVFFGGKPEDVGAMFEKRKRMFPKLVGDNPLKQIRLLRATADLDPSDEVGFQRAMKKVEQTEERIRSLKTVDLYHPLSDSPSVVEE